MRASAQPHLLTFSFPLASRSPPRWQQAFVMTDLKLVSEEEQCELSIVDKHVLRNTQFGRTGRHAPTLVVMPGAGENFIDMARWTGIQ